MPRISLSPYVIKVKKKRSKQCENLETLFGTNTSLVDVIKTIKSEYKTKPYKVKNSKKAFKFQDMDKLDYNIDGIKITQDIIYYGEYGVLQGIMNTDTGEIKPEAIGKDESPVVELTFTYAQDSLVKFQSYIIVQSYSKMSYKTIFNSLLKEWLEDKFKTEITVDIDPLIDSDLVKIIESEGRIVEINLMSHDVPREAAENLLKSTARGLEEATIEIENMDEIKLSLSPSKGRSLAPIRTLSTLERNLRQMVLNSNNTPFYEVTNCEVKTINVKVASESKDYTVYLDPGQPRFKQILPITEEDIISEEGIINNGSILITAREYVGSIVGKYRPEFIN